MFTFVYFLFTGLDLDQVSLDNTELLSSLLKSGNTTFSFMDGQKSNLRDHIIEDSIESAIISAGTSTGTTGTSADLIQVAQSASMPNISKTVGRFGETGTLTETFRCTETLETSKTARTGTSGRFGTSAVTSAITPGGFGNAGTFGTLKTAKTGTSSKTSGTFGSSNRSSTITSGAFGSTGSSTITSGTFGSAGTFGTSKTARTPNHSSGPLEPFAGLSERSETSELIEAAQTASIPAETTETFETSSVPNESRTIEFDQELISVAKNCQKTPRKVLEESNSNTFSSLFKTPKKTPIKMNLKDMHNSEDSIDKAFSGLFKTPVKANERVANAAAESLLRRTPLKKSPMPSPFLGSPKTPIIDVSIQSISFNQDEFNVTPSVQEDKCLSLEISPLSMTTPSPGSEKSESLVTPPLEHTPVTPAKSTYVPKTPSRTPLSRAIDELVMNSPLKALSDAAKRLFNEDGQNKTLVFLSPSKRVPKRASLLKVDTR